MPGRKDDQDNTPTLTPADPIDLDAYGDSLKSSNPNPSQVVVVDGKTVPADQADTQKIFGDGRPPSLPPNASGQSQDPTIQVAGAQRSADDILSGRVPKDNAQQAARANDAKAVFDADTPDGSDRVEGALTRSTLAVARGPHYFTEQVDNVFLCDVLVYVCGANVTPHLKGTVSWSYGLGDTPNTCSFTLDNSNDKFTITPENVRFNHFHAGTAPNESGEYDESAKAKIYLYKNNQLPLPVGNGFYTPNTPPDQSGAGRRFPLNIHGSIFHKMDPIRVWVRVSQYDEWLPVFTGYLTRHTYSDDWLTNSREVTISASDIRDLMGKMRVQHNTVLYQLKGTQATTDAWSPNDALHRYGTPATSDATGTTAVSNSSRFWDDVMRKGDRYQFAWAGMSFKQISEYMTVGGMAPAFSKSPSREDKDTQKKLNQLNQDRDTQTTAITTAKQKLDSYEKFVANPPTSQSPTVNADTQARVKEAKVNQIPQLKADIEALQRALDATNLSIKTLSEVPHRVGIDPIHGIGRMDSGVTVRYPASLNQDTSAKSANADRLDRWYRVCTFGSPVRTAKPPSNRVGKQPVVSSMDEKPDMTAQNVRYWTIDEIANPKTGAGTRCRVDDLWAPDNQLVHWLFPPVGQSGAESKNITDVTINTTTATTRQWVSRREMIQEFSNMVDYRWWVTGCGDIVFEFANYDFEPQDYGPWQDVLTVDLHTTASTLDEEAGDVPTALITYGDPTGNPGNFNTSQLNSFEPPPNDCIYSPNLMSRMGVKINTKQYTWIRDVKLLTKLAVANFQRELGEAEQSSVSLGFRPWIHPNRPIKFIPRDRISLTSSVHHSMTIFGECTTTMEMAFTRQIDTTGLRRYFTGGAHQPLSFGILGGVIGLKESLTQRVDFTAQQTKHLPSLTDPSQRAKMLDENVARDTGNASDKFPTGTDVYNVADYLQYDSDGNVLPSNEARRAQAVFDADAYAAEQEAAVAGAAGVATEVDGVIYGSSGVQSLNNPQAQAAVEKPSTASASKPISIGVGSSTDALLAVGSDASKQLQQNITSANGFDSADIYNLGSIIASQTRNRGVTPQEKLAIGWAVLNGQGANGSVKNLPADGIAKAAAQYQPKWVDNDSVDVARKILSGGADDPTGGATGFAQYDPNTPYSDPRICNALTGQIVAVDPGATRTADGQAISDIGKFVFFKRNPAREAQAQAAAPTKTVHLPAPFDKIEDFTKAAAAKYRISEAVLCGYIKHECNGYYGSPDRLKPNGTGDIGAGTNWVNFEQILFEFAPGRLTRGNQLIRENNRVLMTFGTGEVLRIMWHRSDERSFPSVFVKVKVVPADQTEFKGIVAGNVAMAQFFAGKASAVLANPSDTSLLHPYALEIDPLTAVIASPDVNVSFSARAIRNWLDLYKGNNIQTVVHGKYADMDLGGYSIDTYYKASYAMGSGSGQGNTLLQLSLRYDVSPVDFTGVPVPSTAKPSGVPVVNGMAKHGNVGLGEYILKEAYESFWPIIKSRSDNLLGQCGTGDVTAVQELEKRFQNGQSLDQLLGNLYKKQNV